MDIEELKKLAEAAGGKEWHADVGGDLRAIVCHGDGDVLAKCYSNIGHQPEAVLEDDIAKYIAAANPQTVLAIIRELEEARRDAERYRWIRSEWWNLEMGFNGPNVDALVVESRPAFRIPMRDADGFDRAIDARNRKA